METKKVRPNPGRKGEGREKLRYKNRHFYRNIFHPEISTFLAKKILHDIHAVMERKPVPLAHLRRGAP